MTKAKTNQTSIQVRVSRDFLERIRINAKWLNLSVAQLIRQSTEEACDVIDVGRSRQLEIVTELENEELGAERIYEALEPTEDL